MSSPPLCSNISLDDFEKILSQYPDVLKLVSVKKQPKKPKDGESKTLEEIDKWRDSVSERSGQQGGSKGKAKSDEKTLDSSTIMEIVNWKLKRGQFRPTILPLVASNSTKELESIVNKALSMPPPEQVTGQEAAEEDGDALVQVSAMIKHLTKLKGIGPATATAVLSTMFSDTIPMFSDEAFRWVMMDGSKSSGGWNRKIAYNAKEYAEFFGRVRTLCRRLTFENKGIAIGAGSVEKVGWVLGQQAALGLTNPAEKSPLVVEKQRDHGLFKGSESSKQGTSSGLETTENLSKTIAKRKEMSVSASEAPLRRSKRNRPGTQDRN
ncbi:hypothetical protein TWF694_010722 [Orbilia ellipsospora]|uniref:Uncharacterized protein n=1 Tax=Orbilia ellipsospora TaxID=2528407 RepID=A0AAV9X6V7_9PEZI